MRASTDAERDGIVFSFVRFADSMESFDVEPRLKPGPTDLSPPAAAGGPEPSTAPSSRWVPLAPTAVA
jgi:hypothetical protein